MSPRSCLHLISGATRALQLGAEHFSSLVLPPLVSDRLRRALGHFGPLLPRQRLELLDEFTALDKKLEDAVGAYNAKFGERFRYKGEDYLDTIKADSRAEKTLSDAEQKLHVLEAKSRSPQR